MISDRTERNMQWAGVKPAFCVLMFFCASVITVAQEATSTSPPAKRDTAFADRKIVRSDSLPVPFPYYGALARRSTDTLLDLSKYDRRFVQYNSASDLLIRATPFMPLSHGGFSQHNAVSIAGGWNADLGLSVNGRRMVDPWSSQYQLSQLAPDAYETFEILTGTHAVGLAASTTLSAFNAQEMRFNSATPYTHMWYSQGGGELIAADVSMAQNVAPGVNVNVGVRRSGAYGRYVNQEFDVWNVRANTHWAVDSLTNLRISYHLTSQNTGLPGGLRTTLPLDNLTEATAPPVFFYLQDEMRRHDVTLSGLHRFDTAGTHEVFASLYVSSTSMLRIRDSTLFTSATDTLKNTTFRGQLYGMMLRSRHQLGVLDLRLGASVDVFALDSTVYNDEGSDVQPQVFGHLDLPLSEMLTFTGAARIAVEHGNVLTSAGAGLTFALGASSLRLDASTIQRSASPAEGIDLVPERHLLGLAEYRGRFGAVDVLAQAFYRTVSDAIVTTSDRDTAQLIRTTTSVNGGTTSMFGLVAQATYTHDWLELRPVIRVHDSPLPLFSGELSAAFVYRVGRNSVRLGAKGAFVTTMETRQYVPLTWTYIAPVESQGLVGNGLDLFLTAILGNASVRVSYENILGQRWYTTAIAPEIIRDLRISVSWSFFD